MAKRRAPTTVLITGASSGIGRALAIEYARRGARVMAVARREAELASLCEQITATGGSATHAACDVADPEAAAETVRRAERELGSLDMVIANAGIGGVAHASQMQVAAMARMIDVNVRGAMATLIAAIPIMLAQKAGQLVGVSSLAGRRALPTSAVYSASKAALSVFLEGLRIDLDPSGLAVTDVQPGFVDTPITEKNEFPMPFMWDAPKAARVIADRLQKAPRILAFPLPLDWLTALSRHLPYAVHASISRRMSSQR
ncbi:MAG: SDR family NAD(P)-dependent oxidoreductase [Labilithrix sp.]|nr:SDR family NAD(P)-dependent oxidoreductase [Labilithrix sp.]